MLSANRARMFSALTRTQTLLLASCSLLLACSTSDLSSDRDGDPGKADEVDGSNSGSDAGVGDGGDDLPPASTPVQRLLNDGFYPRSIRLADDTIIASIVAPQAGSGRLGGTILESTDHGLSFEVVGNIDGDFSIGGLCCATLYELPRAIGSFPAGTLLWSASAGGDNPNAPMRLPVFASQDRGRSWSFVSNVAVAGVNRSKGGLWEPEFSMLDDGSLVCHWSDETDPAHSQKLIAARSTNGVNWGEYRNTVALLPFAARPGMPVVVRPPGGPFIMSYEVCGTDGCGSRLRFSNDGWNWGNVRDIGQRPTTMDGKHFRHAPTLTWGKTPSGANRLYLVGQELFLGNGAKSPDNGLMLLANTEGGHGNWFEVPAPVPVPEAFDNFCPNYSSTVLPLHGGSVALEIASKWEDNICRPFFARGPLLGTGDSSGLESGRSYRLLNLLSEKCLDVAGGQTQAGANIQQWDCNGLEPQRFVLDAQGDDVVTLRAANSNLCLTLEGGNQAAGSNVVQGDCSLANARWRMENVGYGYYRFAHAESGSCLDVAGGSGQAGGNVQQWHCNDLSPQIWRVLPL